MPYTRRVCRNECLGTKCACRSRCIPWMFSRCTSNIAERPPMLLCAHGKHYDRCGTSGPAGQTAARRNLYPAEDQSEKTRVSVSRNFIFRAHSQICDIGAFKGFYGMGEGLACRGSVDTPAVPPVTGPVGSRGRSQASANPPEA